MYSAIRITELFPSSTSVCCIKVKGDEETYKKAHKNFLIHFQFSSSSYEFIYYCVVGWLFNTCNVRPRRKAYGVAI